MKRFSFLKDKYFWYALLAGLLIFLPNLIAVNIIHGGNPIIKFLGLDAGRFGSASGWPHWGVFFTWLFVLPASMGWQFFLPFILGLYIFFEMILGLDLIVKRKGDYKKILPHLFLFTWMIIPFTYHTLYAGATLDERYFFYIYPPLFMVSAIGLLTIPVLINKVWKGVSKNKYTKYIPTLIVLTLIAFGGYAQIVRGDALIQNKRSSYFPVKAAGLWIKENSEPTDIVISGSRYQNIYYAERATYNFALETYADREFILEQMKEQNIPRNVHGYLTEEAFDELISELKPRYMAVSIFETHPPWAYTYADRHPNVRPVQAYFSDAEQTNLLLIIYEFNWEGVKIPEPIFRLTGDE